MVNGRTSRQLYLGAYALIALLVVSITGITVAGAAVPQELRETLFALLAFIAGAHIQPPTGSGKGGSP